MQTYERRPHARRASTSSLPVYSTTSMGMSTMNVGTGGTMHRRTGSASPPAWKPVLKSRPQSFQVVPALAASTDLSSSGNGEYSSAAALAGPVVQRISTASFGVPKAQHNVISPILTHSGHGPTSIFETRAASTNASTRPRPTHSATAPPSSFPSSPNMSTPSLQYARQSILQPRRGSLNPTRRESRPLRSSPLTGPSLAVGTDGEFTGSDSEDNEKPRYRPSRISSTPDVAAAFAALKEARAVDEMVAEEKEKRKSRSAPASPAGTLNSGVALPVDPTSLVADVADTHRQAQAQTVVPTPPLPARQSRRLSLGFKRISALPGLPSFSHKKSPAKDINVETQADARRPVGELGALPQSQHQLQEQHARTTSTNTAAGRRGSRDGRFSDDVPPVPVIPDWARSLSPASPTSTTFSASTAREASYTPAMRRRPSTAPSTLSPSFVPSPPSPTSASTAAVKTNYRRSRQTVSTSSFSSPSSSSFVVIPPSPTRAAPNTSMDPEANWMSAGSVPRFSRLGVVAGSVVMPVSAKDAEKRKRRQSAGSVATISVSGGVVGTHEGVQGESENGSGYEYEYANGSVKSRAPSIRSLSSVKTVQKEKREDKDREKGREREKLMSGETAQRMRDALEAAAQARAHEDSVVPPSPPFLRNTSSTSLATSSGSTGTGTSVCSVGSIGTVASVASVRTVATTASVSSSTTVSEGVRTPQTSFEGVGPVGVGAREVRKGLEVRVNDVTVEIIDVVRPPVPVHVGGVGEGGAAAAKKAVVVEKGGPLRRIWKKVVGRA